MRLLKTLALAAGLASAPALAAAQAIAIATSNPGAIYHSIGTAIAKVANTQGINATLQTATSPNQYIPVVAAGEVEFGIANLPEIIAAATGSEHFDGRPYPDLRVVGLLFPLKTAIYVRKDSDIRSIADLKGRPMPDGYTAQKVILPLLDALYATAGLTRADTQPVQVPSVVGGADAFASGQADGFFFAMGAGKVREADAAVGGIRALPLQNDEKTVAVLKEKFPAGYLMEVQPGPAETGVTEPMHVLAYPQLIFASASTPEETVYQITKAIYENKPAMVEVLPAFNAFDPARMVGETGPVEYHPGAIRFYKEAGVWKE